MPGGKTVVTNAGSNGKFLGVLDLDVGKGALKNVRYTLLPVFADLIKPDGAMAALIERLRAPYAAQFSEKLASCDQLLYRRGNFIGPMDQVICDAMRQAARRADRAVAGFPLGHHHAGEPIDHASKTCWRRRRSAIPRPTCRT